MGIYTCLVLLQTKAGEDVLGQSLTVFIVNADSDQRARDVVRAERVRFENPYGERCVTEVASVLDIDEVEIPSTFGQSEVGASYHLPEGAETASLLTEDRAGE